MNRVYSAPYGEVVERPKAPRLKRGDEQSSVGSNPTLSAKLKQSISVIKVNLGLVAQLDRASVYGTEGSGFESLLARLNSFWIR